MLRCYLDVVGVLVPSGAGSGGFGDFEARGWGVPVSPRMLAEVAALPVERLWLTTWCDEANTALCPLIGWEPAEFLPRNASPGWWKLDALLEAQPAGEPFIWCDDELGFRQRDGDIRRRLDSLGAPYLLIAPPERSGLRPEDLERMRAFAAVAEATGS